MSISVRIPSVLRGLTADDPEVYVAGGTLGEVLDALDHMYPGLKARIVDEAGDVQRFINVYVDGHDVRDAAGLATKIPEGAQVSIIAAVAGGSGVAGGFQPARLG